jgi:hypothetical protein
MWTRLHWGAFSATPGGDPPALFLLLIGNTAYYNGVVRQVTIPERLEVMAW